MQKINILYIVKVTQKTYNNFVKEILYLIILNKQCQSIVLKDLNVLP